MSHAGKAHQLCGDALRERELAIRGRATPSASSVLREEPAPYRTTPGDIKPA